MKRILQTALSLGLAGGWAGPSFALTLTNFPTADTFVRAAAPSANYGGAGNLAVSGPTATNRLGQQNGQFDTLMRFSLAGTVAAFDTAFGAGNWELIGVTLRLTEQAAPNNDLFNRGVGSFEVRWLSSDAWTEGTGNPNTPTTDGVTYNDLPGLLSPANDLSLGVFANAGLNTQQAFSLPLSAAGFRDDVLQGNDVTLHLVAISPDIGFTFNSRSAASLSSRPFLELTAVLVPEPGAVGLLLLGGAVLVSRAIGIRRKL